MNKLLRLSCIIAFSICLSQNALLGQFTVDVDEVTTVAGSQVFVDVFAEGPLALGFDIPLDIGGDGIGVLPTGLTFQGFTSNFDVLATGGPPNEDVLVGGGNILSPAVALPTVVSTLEFFVDASVTPGTIFNINILRNNSLTATDQNFVLTRGAEVTAFDGSITIPGGNTIPEPGSAFALVAVCLVGCMRRRK